MVLPSLPSDLPCHRWYALPRSPDREPAFDSHIRGSPTLRAPQDATGPGAQLREPEPGEPVVPLFRTAHRPASRFTFLLASVPADLTAFSSRADPHHRSEERRVGKECRSRWSPYH